MERSGRASSTGRRRRGRTGRWGDSIAALLVVTAVMCVGYFGFDDDKTLHMVAAIALLAVLALKIAVVRRLHGLSRFLPALGISVWLLLALTWLTSAGDFLAQGP